MITYHLSLLILLNAYFFKNNSYLSFKNVFDFFATDLILYYNTSIGATVDSK